jgi:Gpi18-like mannosyltransferase
MGYFPLYPMLIRGLSQLTGLPLALAGMLIAQLSYLGAILILYRLARLIRDEHAYAIRVVLSLLLFPSAFFFFAVYAEPLSLAFSLLAVYFALLPQAQYIYSGLALGIASAARPVGFLINLILMVEFVRRRKYSFGTFFKLGLGLFFSGLGVILFVWYLYTLTGSFRAIPEAQSAWLRQWQLPWVTLGKSVLYVLAGPGAASDWFSYEINGIDFFFTLLALGLTIVAVRRTLRGYYPWSLTVYMIVSLIFLLAQQGVGHVPLWGMTRWVAALFPIYLILGDLIQNKWIQWAIWLISGSLLVLFMAWWSTGRWVG